MVGLIRLALVFSKMSDLQKAIQQRVDTNLVRQSRALKEVLKFESSVEDVVGLKIKSSSTTESNSTITSIRDQIFI